MPCCVAVYFKSEQTVNLHTHTRTRTHHRVSRSVQRQMLKGFLPLMCAKKCILLRRKCRVTHFKLPRTIHP